MSLTTTQPAPGYIILTRDLSPTDSVGDICKVRDIAPSGDRYKIENTKTGRMLIARAKDVYVPSPGESVNDQAAKIFAAHQATQQLNKSHSAMMTGLSSVLQAPPSLTTYANTPPSPTPPKKKVGARKFNDGDKAEIKGGSGSYHSFDIGTIVTVKEYAHNGEYVCIRDNGYSQYVQARDPALFKPSKIKPKVTLDSVIMSAEKKEEIRASISQMKNTSKIFEDWGFSEVFEKGTAVSLLFWGIPGTGKTLMAQAISDELACELKIYGTADIQSQEPGGAERMIRTIFNEAKKKDKKRIILFDECESLLMDRNEVGAILGAQVNALLTEIERFDGIVIFTTNRMGKLDPALERRLSAKIEFTFPDKNQRKDIWKRLLPKKAPLAKDVDLDRLADYPLAGGNIKNAVLNSARRASYEGAKEISMKHFQQAIEAEAKALQAFVVEYEKQSHTSLAGYIDREPGRGLVVNTDLREKLALKRQLIEGVDEDEDDEEEVSNKR